MTPNSAEITNIVETGLKYLRNMPAIVEPRLRTVSDGDVSLPSSFTGKWLITIFRCCLVPIIIRFVEDVLSGLNFSLLDSIKNKMSLRQSLSRNVNS